MTKTGKKPSKHRNVKTPCDGFIFDSVWEAMRWRMLKGMAARGVIHGLRRQVSFLLHGKCGTVITRYRADFVYIAGGRLIVEDAKGNPKLTAMYKLKRKWMLAEHNIKIRETYRNDPSGW